LSFSKFPPSSPIQSRRLDIISFLEGFSGAQAWEAMDTPSSLLHRFAKFPFPEARPSYVHRYHPSSPVGCVCVKTQGRDPPLLNHAASPRT
jgi:hypothetical protein